MTPSRCEAPLAATRRTRALVAVLGVLVAGCSTFSPDKSVGEVQAASHERLGAQVMLPNDRADPTLATESIKRLLSRPLTMDAAVELALLNNPGLRAAFSGLGVPQSDLVQAGRMSNPVFSFSNKRNSEAQSIERALVVNLVSLLVLPLRQDVARRQLEMAQLELVTDVVRTATDARKAWVNAVAAQASVSYFEQVRNAAEAGAELASRMARVGNFNKLAYMREQAFYADATAQLARARQTAVGERERLTRLLGLSGPDTGYALPERLPDLPDAPLDRMEAEQTALDRRLDVQLARSSTAAVAADLGLIRTTRFINVLEAGYANESESGERRKNGYEIEVSIPLFDWGDAKVQRAEAIYMQSVHRTTQVAITAQSEFRERYLGYRSAYDIARHYRDEIVPLRKRIAEETTLRYNGMLIGVFELLADAREQVVTVNAYLDALRDFWIAQSDLELALSGVAANSGARARSALRPAGGSVAAH